MLRTGRFNAVTRHRHAAYFTTNGTIRNVQSQNEQGRPPVDARPLHCQRGMPTGGNASYPGYLEPRGRGRQRTQSAWFPRSEYEVDEEQYYDNDLAENYNYGGGASRSAGDYSPITG